MVGWHHWLNGHEFESGSWWWTGRPLMLQSMGSQSWTQLNEWTELKRSYTEPSTLTYIFFPLTIHNKPVKLCNLLYRWRNWCLETNQHILFHTVSSKPLPFTSSGLSKATSVKWGKNIYILRTAWNISYNDDDPESTKFFRDMSFKWWDLRIYLWNIYLSFWNYLVSSNLK